ncbi:SPOR domain-containing protein [Prevotella sp. E9-3]|uniref:HU domain-containing protein n=1 Tax=Prevotella sp. E9-3 TaxID=2913621 RepID=UPI001EDAEDDB|nr:SPOR domain-containing protein [Prevotella sp. E9-3]UKK47017.1 SPOR domain-containing protein [Prevotella sp. E9-3]
MIELNRHIEILLLNNDCVIVPGFGGFMAHHSDARYDESDKMFLPPLRTLGFNPQLKINDHLLVQSYIEAYDISYPEALRRIENEVEELKQHLESEGEYELTDLGTITLNDEGRYEFQPCEAGILSPMLYGLSSFSMQTISSLLQSAEVKEEKKEALIKPIQLEEITKDDNHEKIDDSTVNDDTIVIRMSWIRNMVAMAASILLFFFISTPVGNSELSETVQQSSVLPVITAASVQEKQEQIAETPEENQPNAESVSMERSEEMINSEAPVKETSSVYTIVLASQTPLIHAEEFIARLSKSGIEGAQTMSMQNTAKVRVVIGSFNSEEEAQSQLRKYRADNNNFKEAWVLHVKD